MISRNIAIELVIECLNEVFAQTGQTPPDTINDDTVLVGGGAVVDSLGVVSLIVEVEQRLEAAQGISVTLANDKAMSQRNSPFRTVGVLADHVLALVEEASS
jgi:acyl carrier protein